MGAGATGLGALMLGGVAGRIGGATANGKYSSDGGTKSGTGGGMGP